MIPKIRQYNENITKKCENCGEIGGSNDFSKTKNIFSKDGRLPFCNKCIAAHLKKYNFNWAEVDRICRYADIPWIPSEWERIKAQNTPENTFPAYNKIFFQQQYEGIDWEYYNSQFVKLRQAGMIEDELPELREKKYKELREEWGHSYSDEQLDYLSQLYAGMQLTQNVDSTLQKDQAKKICKLSVEIDSQIREGSKDVDKYLSAYDRLIKIADFTPKNIKNAADFETTGELYLWLEKRGWINKFYDGAQRDVIDETLLNIESYNQSLYLNEGGMGEAISERIEGLRAINEVEKDKTKKPQLYDITVDNDGKTLNDYENDGYSTEIFDPIGGDE